MPYSGLVHWRSNPAPPHTLTFAKVNLKQKIGPTLLFTSARQNKTHLQFRPDRILLGPLPHR